MISSYARRMTFTGSGKFDLAYLRHTDKCFTVYHGLTARQNVFVRSRITRSFGRQPDGCQAAKGPPPTIRRSAGNHRRLDSLRHALSLNSKQPFYSRVHPHRPGQV
jgi:hypothetical protein